MRISPVSLAANLLAQAFRTLRTEKVVWSPIAPGGVFEAVLAVNNKPTGVEARALLSPCSSESDTEVTITVSGKTETQVIREQWLINWQIKKPDPT